MNASAPIRSIRLNKDMPVALHYQIRRGIEDLIATGVLRPGDRLPTVVQLADELGVSLTTAVRVVRDMRGSGALVTKRGVGITVAPTTPPTTELLIGGVELLPDNERSRFYDEMLSGLQYGYRDDRRRFLTTFTRNHALSAQEMLAAAAARHVDGLIAYQWTEANLDVLRSVATAIPLVMVQQECPRSCADSVISDVAPTLRSMLTERLRKGCREFAFVSLRVCESQTESSLQQCFMATLEEAGVNPRVLIQHSPDADVSPDAHQRRWDQLIEQTRRLPDNCVIFALWSDTVLRIHSLGRPYDLIAYTEYGRTADRLKPVASTIYASIADLMAAAVPLLQRRAPGRTPRVVRVPPRVFELSR